MQKINMYRRQAAEACQWMDCQVETDEKQDLRYIEVY